MNNNSHPNTPLTPSRQPSFKVGPVAVIAGTALLPAMGPLAVLMIFSGAMTWLAEAATDR